MHSLLLAYWWVRKDWKKEPHVALSFAFLPCYHFQHKLLTSEKKYERVSWLFVALRTSLPSFCIWIKASPGSNSKHGVSRLSALTAYLAVDATHLPVLTLSFTESPCITDPCKSCAHGASVRLFAFGTRNSSGCAILTSPLLTHVLHCPISHHIQTTSLKVQIIKNFKMATHRIRASEALVSMSPCATDQVQCTGSWLCCQSPPANTILALSTLLHETWFSMSVFHIRLWGTSFSYSTSR